MAVGLGEPVRTVQPAVLERSGHGRPHALWTGALRLDAELTDATEDRPGFHPLRYQSLRMRHRLSAVPLSESWTANAPTAVELFAMASSLPLCELRIL